MFEEITDGLKITDELKITLALVVFIGCLMVYMMKDTLFPPKQVTFDPVITEKAAVVNSEKFIPSETFTGTKSGYIYTLGDNGQGYYKDTV